MSSRLWIWSLLVSVATLAPLSAAHASSFDMIVADSVMIFANSGNAGFSTGNDIALIVNAGPTNIDDVELFSATFQATSSDPLVDAVPFINNPGPPVAPILPNEAVGTVSGFSPLLAPLLPGETLRNTSPLQVYGLIVHYPDGYDGIVTFDVTMSMGGQEVHYPIWMRIMQYVDFSIYVAHAIRVSSVPMPTAAHSSSWGAIKSLYR